MALFTLLEELDKADVRLNSEINRQGLDIVLRHLEREEALQRVLNWYRARYGYYDR